MQQSKWDRVYNGQTEKNDKALLIRTRLNGKTLVNWNLKNQSILLKKEDVYAVLEYALNRLLAFIQPTDLLVIDSWQVAHRIEDPSKTNIQKCWLAPLPGFDHESFPFVITSGAESYNIVNVKEGFMNPVVYSPGTHCVA